MPRGAAPFAFPAKCNLVELNVLFIGDVVGRPGRQAVAALLPALRAELSLHLVICNGENSAGGFGITPATAQELLDSGVDVLTTGNHVWDQKEAWPALESYANVVRPANLPPGVPGHGTFSIEVGGTRVMVANLMGRLYMHDIDCPFRCADALAQSRGQDEVLIVDMHAEATSEKMAMGFHLDGRAAMVVGTHTHVATADQRLLPQGTAFVTDVGMVGPRDSIIGMEPGPIVQRFISSLPARFKVAEGPVVFNSVLARINAPSGRATGIQRVDRLFER